MRPRLQSVVLLLLLVAPAAGSDELDPIRALAWGPGEVEHLLSRAGFGASAREIRRWAERPPEALVEHLLAQPGAPPRFEHQRMDAGARRRLRELSEVERRRAIARARKSDRAQGIEFRVWWIERMLSGERALEERMTLFWHGFFTSELRIVKRASLMIEQNATLREHAVGSYADLLRAMLEDPALLLYLDNDSNFRGKPNENLARELLELFSLGEGRYSEEDVREAARALTGRTLAGGRYRLLARRHDHGDKTILGVRGPLDGNDLARILLAQPACSEWMARRLIAYFEGLEPEPERLAEYAGLLREGQYELRPFLRRLFTDPAFYRDEVRGTRVAAPIDYLVGICRRSGLRPPAHFLLRAADLLGQKLLDPPNVKGWEEGLAWIDTATVISRANVAGALLGAVSAEDLAQGGERARKSFLAKLLRRLERSGYRPRPNLAEHLARAGAQSDAEIVRELCEVLLAVELSASSRARLEQHLASERVAAGIEAGELLEERRCAEPILLGLAHLVLTLPEAHLL